MAGNLVPQLLQRRDVFGQTVSGLAGAALAIATIGLAACDNATDEVVEAPDGVPGIHCRTLIGVSSTV